MVPIAPSHDDESDEELMRRLAAGDTAALTPIVQRHQERVIRLAQRFLGRADLAEDVAQDAFVKLYRSAAMYQPEARFTTWLYRLVANLCWDRRRGLARARRREQEHDGAATVPDAATAMEADERTQRVRAAVAALPDRQRLAVILHRYHELSHKDIATVTGWSVSAVESCLVRAYATLRERLADLMDPPPEPPGPRR